MKICSIIPAYNEGKTIAELVERLRNRGLDVVVVDDGSSDQTAKFAQDRGAAVLSYGENRGKGAALRAGFSYALNQDYQAVITLDGDGQHSPEDIPQFINAAKANSNVAMVVGDRLTYSKGMPPLRWLTNNLMSLLISIICWQNIRDSQCGFRLIKTELLKKLRLISTNYEIETEIIIQACRKGFKIKFVPIQTIYALQSSQINPLTDTIRFFKYLFKIVCPFLFKKQSDEFRQFKKKDG